VRCLSDAEIQAVADRESSEDERSHADGCEACAARVAERRRRLAPIERLLAEPEAMPAGLARRVEEALASSSPIRGATRLRPASTARRRWRRVGWGAGLAAAAAVVIMLVVLPTMEGPGTVSAAEILEHSLERLAQAVTSGVELREYELALEGVPNEIMPDEEGGTYRIQQLIDHDTPGRYRISTFAPDGGLISAISEDPAAGRRTSFARIEGQAYRFDFALKDTGPRFSMADLERLHAEACIAIMQASGDHKLSVIEDVSGTSYQIQIPRVSVSQTAVWDLQQARVRIDAGDYRVRELEVRGTLFKKPYHLSYRLTRHNVRAAADVAAEEFQVPEVPGALVLKGAGTQNLMRDIVTAALRELAEAREAR
jgi:hypothetical protein